VVIDYLVPSASSADAPVLQFAGTILSNGTSSRLYQSLVYKQQVASSASARADLRSDHGLFQFTTIAAGGKSIEAVEKAALDEVEKLRSAPVSEAELSKARNQLVTAALRRRETADGRAAALGEAIVALGSADRVNTEIARLSAVTAADILEAAKKYFTPSNRVVIRYKAGSQEQGGASQAAAAAPKQAPAADTKPEETAPPPSAPRPAVIPKPLSTTLPNGMRVIVAPRPGTGLVTILAAIKAGASDDPPETSGLADFTAAMLLRGAGSRSATQVAESIEKLGGSISSSAGWDSSTVSVTVMTSRAAEAMSVLSDVLRRPTFAPAEASRLQSQRLDGLAVSLRSPGTIAQHTAARVVFEDGPYGHALSGTPESIRAIKPGDVREFYLANYAPQRTVLVFGGDISLQEASSLATRYFGSQKPSRVYASKETGPHPSAPIGRVVVVDKPDAGQAAVVLAQAGIPRTDPEYTVARVANAIFGEGYSSRINEEIRIKRGLSYGASSRFDMRRRGGLFSASAQTRNSAVAEVAKLLKEELGKLMSGSPNQEEMTARKASLAGSYARRLETGAGIAGATADLAVYDLPLSTLGSYPADIQTVTASQVGPFASRHLSASQSNIIIVGDSRQFLPALQKEFLDIEVIPVAQLDLNKSSLRKQ
jgi:zinc protease